MAAESYYECRVCQERVLDFSLCPYCFDTEPPTSIWPRGTLRGEYDPGHDRIVCADCDWYDTGGPTGCSWRYHDHREEEHRADSA